MSARLQEPPVTTSASPAQLAASEQTLTFGTLQISFDDRILHPRGWTVAQANWAAELLDGLPPGPVLELCAGAGHIGLLATMNTDRRLVLVDVNPVACHWARVNADAAQAGSVDVREADLTAALGDDEKFPLIIADPPWVATSDIGRFPADPRIAIDGGSDGLALARQCLDVIEGHLAQDGAAVLQLGTPAQVDAARAYVDAIGGTLTIDEVRTYERGVLALVRRRSEC